LPASDLPSAADFNFAGIASTLVILVILAGVKPLEDAYRARNQSCNLEIRAEHGFLTPELLKKTLRIRNGQLKRFMIQPTSKRGIDELHVALARVSPKDVHNFMEKLEGLQAVRAVKRQK
jgi:putative Mg2+ transporter-C (MgtC) family protein